MKTYRVDSIFKVKSGQVHSKKELSPGTIPLISCGDSDNGLVGFYDVERSQRHSSSITVAYNGSWPMLSKFHPYEFGAKDDVAVLVPIKKLSHKALIYIAATLSRNTWRYSYGRKCFKAKLEKFEIPLPIASLDALESNWAELLLPQIAIKDHIPETTESRLTTVPKLKWGVKFLTDLFVPTRGDFHSLKVLDDGVIPTVSRTSVNNGIVGFFSARKGISRQSAGCITISTVGGDAFVQSKPFLATDNVIVCAPLTPYRPSTLYFLAYLLNRQKWRYSYGRQCYMNKIAKLTLPVPLGRNGELDEDAVEKIVNSTPYRNYVRQKTGL